MPARGRWKPNAAILAIGIAGVCLGLLLIVRWLAVPEVRKPAVRHSTPRLLHPTEAEACPIPLPQGASNIRYAVWSMGSVTQSWIRFNAPVAVCLSHATRLLEPYAKREGWSMGTRQIAGDTGVVCILDPTEVDLSWFDPDESSGTVFRADGGRAPVIWVDTNSGSFYCEIKNDLHSLSPP